MNFVKISAYFTYGRNSHVSYSFCLNLVGGTSSEGNRQTIWTVSEQELQTMCHSYFTRCQACEVLKQLIS